MVVKETMRLINLKGYIGKNEMSELLRVYRKV